MDRQIARFIGWVVAKQAGLLIIAAALVLLQALWLYRHVRTAAIEQMGSRQRLIAEQTARGIESYYSSIIETLDLLRRTDREDDTAAGTMASGSAEVGRLPAGDGDDSQANLRRDRRPGAPPGSSPEPHPRTLRELVLGGARPPPPGERPSLTLPPGVTGAAARQVLLPVFWEQLQDRVSQLFILDRPTMRVLSRFGEPDVLPPEQIIEARREWLSGVEAPSVSKVGELAGRWGNLVCVPLPGNRRLLCAVVPVARIEERFLNNLNAPDGSRGAMMTDESGRVLSALDPTLIGRSLVSDEPDPAFKAFVVQTLSGESPTFRVFDRPIRLGGRELGRAVTNVQPVNVPNGRWWIAVSSNLAEVDALLKDLFWRVALLASVAIGLFTLLFSGLAVNQIRQRARLERVRHELLAREIEQARQIQLAWLPRADARIAAGEVFAVNRPANHISGDFYNWFDLSDGRSCVLIGDVTGHGMSAAFLMATTQLLARAALQRLDGDPGAAMNAVNRELCAQVFSGQFVTMTIAVIDPEGGRLLVSTAGHPPGVVCTPGGSVELMGIEPQLVLGVEQDWVYATESMQVPAGATLLLYTDGVIEAASEDGRRFDAGHLLECMTGTDRGDPAETVACVLKAVDRFRGSKELADDLTIVAVRLSGAPVTRDEAPVGAL